MDAQQTTPRTPAELPPGQKAPMVYQNPPHPQNPGPPRFPPANNGPSDGPRFGPAGQPPPLRHLDSRSQLNPPTGAPTQPGQPQFPGPRPPFQGAPPPQQRAPPPRAPGPAFFGRPPQPGGPPPPGRFPAPPGQQPQFQGQRPAQPGFLNRPPFPPPQGAPPNRAPIPNDPRFARPQLPPQQQLDARRGQFRSQMSIDRMAEVEMNRPPSSASLRAEDQMNRPKSAISENGKSSDSETDIKKTNDEQQPTSNEASTKSKTETLEQQNNAKNAADAKASVEPKPAVESTKPPADQKIEEPAKSRPASAAPEKPEAAAKAEPEVSKPPPSPVPPKTPDSGSIKGFDDGKRKSLTSPLPPSPSAEPASEHVTKKKTTFADQEKPEEARKQKEEEAKPEQGIMRKSPSARSIRADAENDSGVDESTQRREAPKTNGVVGSPTKKSREPSEKRSAAGSPIKSPSKSVKSLPRTPDAAPSTAAGPEKKKVPMNKVQVGAAPSPNLKSVRSKIGSLENTTYKPGGGKVKIENRKLDFSKAQPKIAAKNDKYTPSGGDKKIQQVKLQWNAKPKIGSLDNAAYKPGGGDKKIETVKLDFKDKAKPKVGSKENAKHVPGGGSVKSSATPPKTPQDNANNIETQKIEIKAESKIGSMDNMKHKPGGGDKKIFDDKSYLRQTSSSNVGSVSGSGSQSPIPSGASSTVDKNGLPVSDENLNQEC